MFISFIHLGRSFCACFNLLCMAEIVGLRIHNVDMDIKDDMELRWILKIHEEYIELNRISLFSVSTKVQMDEHHYVLQHVNIMNLMVHQRNILNILEVKCNMLQNLGLNICKDSCSSMSNNKDPTSIS